MKGHKNLGKFAKMEKKYENKLFTAKNRLGFE